MDQQIVVVPGLGELRFDDTLTDALVLQAIRRVLIPPPAPRRRYYDPATDSLTTAPPAGTR